jgi:sarcosine oxidase subunit delta
VIRIECPNCGPRNAEEFRYGGEVNARPSRPLDVGEAEWTDYVYMRRNAAGIQTEWWYHRAGCGMWFLAERDTRTNAISRTFLWRAKTSE